MSDKMVICYFVKEGNKSPDDKVTANNDKKMNTWKITATGNPRSGCLTSYKCELIDQDLIIGQTYG